MIADHSDVPAWRLDHRTPLADGHLLGFLGSRAIAGCEAVEGRRYARSIRMPTGAPAVVEVEPEPSEPFVTMWIRGDGAPGAVERAVRRLLDLDADPGAIDATLGADPALRSVVLSAPGMRLPGAVDGFEIAVRAIVGQQVSVAGARTTLGRIAQRFGEPLSEPVGTVVRVFPTPARLADAPRDGLGMPRTRGDAIVEVARAVESGELDLSGEADLSATRERLRAIRGVGGWTEEYVAMRALGDRDAFPVTDLGVRRGFRRLGLPDDTRSMLEHAERWRPWRAYAVIHLWTG
ncbi:MAG TPA: DNA-3-methyladenine glycosylase [Actinomycetota bacterium]|nr:DNA-3-methyladenine glycosylase [Actinomycetota bacterium]